MSFIVCELSVYVFNEYLLFMMWGPYFVFIICGIGIIIGLNSFVLIQIGNLHAAIWCFFSGFLAAVILHLYYLYWRNILSAWHDSETLGSVAIVGVAGATFGSAFSAWYIFNFIYYNLPILPVKSSYHIAAMSATLEAMWGLALIMFTRFFTRQVQFAEVHFNPQRERCRQYYIRCAQ